MLLPLQLGVGGVIVGIATVLLVAMWFYMYTRLEPGTLTGK